MPSMDEVGYLEFPLGGTRAYCSAPAEPNTDMG